VRLPRALRAYCVPQPAPFADRAVRKFSSTANGRAATFTGFSSRGGCATGSVSDVAGPVELLSCAGSCTRACSCTGSCTRAPLLTSFCAPRAPLVTSLVPSRTPLLTPLHANGLGLGIGTRQCCGGCCDGEGGNFSEKGKSPSTGDRLRFDDFVHGQDSTEAVECPCGCQFQMPVLI
jgi:hypothetical protein